MSIIIRCADCGKTFRGNTEYEAEVKFNNHKCKEAEKYKKMSLEELKESIEKRQKGGK